MRLGVHLNRRPGSQPRALPSRLGPPSCSLPFLLVIFGMLDFRAGRAEIAKHPGRLCAPAGTRRYHPRPKVRAPSSTALITPPVFPALLFLSPSSSRFHLLLPFVSFPFPSAACHQMQINVECRRQQTPIGIARACPVTYPSTTDLRLICFRLPSFSRFMSVLHHVHSCIEVLPDKIPPHRVGQCGRRGPCARRARFVVLILRAVAPRCFGTWPWC